MCVLSATQTDIIIPNTLCHPYKHKLSSIKYLLNQLSTYPITKKPEQMELNTIRNILQNNKYNINILMKPQSHKQNIHKDQIHQNTKWATFTYCGKEARQITNLFKDT
jgi:hypothetical protein